MKTCCRPGEMLCEACLSEEEEPKTVRIPRRIHLLPVLPVVQGRSQRPATLFNLPKLRKVPILSP